MLGNAVLERATNFGWPAVQQVRDLCVYFLSAPDLLHYLHDLPNRQSINQSINLERLGNMGFTTISLSSNFKILWACDNI